MRFLGSLTSYLVKRSMSRMPKPNAKVPYVDLTELDELTEHLAEAEEARERAFALLDGINRVLLEALTCESDADVARVCLAVAEGLTGSKFGFIGLLNEAGLFDDIAISDPGWDACKMPNSDAVKLIQNMPIRGVDRSTLRDKESRIVNDLMAHPDHIQPPDGHPVMTSFLGVPLKRAGETVGMIGLGNKEEGYELTDQEAIEALSATFVEVLMSKRMEIAFGEAKGK